LFLCYATLHLNFLVLATLGQNGVLGAEYGRLGGEKKDELVNFEE
jgi:hypothetical protein